MSFNLATMLTESRTAHPEKPLCHIAGQTFSYAQVDEVSGRIATSLRNLGVKPNDKVAVQLPNLPQFLFAYFGVLKAGAVMVPLNPLLRAPEVRYHLRDSDARLLITFETFAEEAVRGAAISRDWPPMSSTCPATISARAAQSISTSCISPTTPGR